MRVLIRLFWLSMAALLGHSCGHDLPTDDLGVPMTLAPRALPGSGAVR